MDFGLSPSLHRLNALLEQIWDRNPFYARKWRDSGAVKPPLALLDDLSSYPLTTRAELMSDQREHLPLGTNLTFPLVRYTRFHQSSGTTGQPIYWADDPESWRWVIQCSHALYSIAGVSSDDLVAFLMPFGASSGPWIMYEGAQRGGLSCFSAGTTWQEQLDAIARLKPSVLVSKTLPLLELAEAAIKRNIPLTTLGVRKIISPRPASLDAESLLVRLQGCWNVPCLDRYGCTEAGSVASECPNTIGMHILETDFIAELLDPETESPAADGELGELVLTNLGRIGRPIVRYRTGDLVRLTKRSCACGRTGAMMIGGVRRKLSRQAL